MSDKPDSLEQKEITDAIDRLQNGNKVEGTCPVHSDFSNAMILNLRIGEQLIYKVDQLSNHPDNDLCWLGGFKFGKRQANGLVAIVLVIGLTVCVLKWGPSLVKSFTTQLPKIEKVNG